MRSVGLDIASCTGMALVDADGEGRGKTIHLPRERGFLRLQLVAQEVSRTLETWEPDVVILEGYAYCRNISSFVTLVELGTVVRQVLYQQMRPWFEVPPTTLKKWVTGKGNAKKDQMAASVKARWDYVSGSDDIIDAFALAQMGQLGPDALLKIPGVFLLNT
jgi:crossover junction endodeoxyribonuclease RuvC